ncbi:hypothetical protein SAMN05892883_1701 [Jatrophihabitans sp. GAS493]|uniref:Ig-like domain repeat protein n=1 Tax=Jatrophihabitans sp. GAS493 TaxID=1907575 RepID=UPI000BB922C3|nr:Ig-like domain repeat protein [Jatrophihabitans sp. GAS493]SOD72296.1 hypothetical protein SAMN05892883_1701 [Jatrophihabitans sp. GAS493]
MKIKMKTAIGGVGTFAVAAGMLVVGAANASAAAPSFQPDPNAAGTVSFYNAAGVQITSGTLSASPFAAYYVASTPALSNSGPKDAAVFYTPVLGQAPAVWQTGDIETTSQTPGAHPSYPGALATITNPVVKDDSGFADMPDHISNFTSTDSADPNVYEVRIFDGVNYWSSDVKVDTAADTWTQVYPTVKTATTLSTITANPASPADSGSTVTLSSTLTAGDATHPAGTVSLLDGATTVPGATFNAATGAVSATVNPADGAHSYSFVFTPTDTATYNGTTSATLAYAVNAPAPAAATTTAVSGPTTGTVGSPVTEHANVTSGSPAAELAAGKGSVQFKVDGANAGAPVALTATGADFAYTPADTSAHVITAAFVPADVTKYLASSDAAGVTVTATAALYAPDPQTIDVNVPQGTLVISTPYTPANPFHLGNMTLSADGTSLTSTPANFGDPAVAASATPGVNNGVTITDTRTGSTGWTASASVSDFTNGANTINGDGLSFTNVAPKYIVGNHIQSGVTPHDITAFKTAAKAFAVSNVGPGTVDVTGKLALTAPTSTLAGLYVATMTFTIV